MPDRESGYGPDRVWVRTRAVPPGLALISHCTQGLRPGLTNAAASRLDFDSCVPSLYPTHACKSQFKHTLKGPLVTTDWSMTLVTLSDVTGAVTMQKSSFGR